MTTIRTALAPNAFRHINPIATIPTQTFPSPTRTLVLISYLAPLRRRVLLVVRIFLAVLMFPAVQIIPTHPILRKKIILTVGLPAVVMILDVSFEAEEIESDDNDNDTNDPEVSGEDVNDEDAAEEVEEEGDEDDDDVNQDDDDGNYISEDTFKEIRKIRPHSHACGTNLRCQSYNASFYKFPIQRRVTDSSWDRMRTDYTAQIHFVIPRARGVW
ncbi:hypothetical protein K440DRAFT_643329 [Wilcoxina mikolae CBS 423.85]|nr:hypothetical protein K440DRAFT_643329 [Wilcoxina mikolae CBS 423.85]